MTESTDSDMRVEYFDELNRLIKEGDHEVVRGYIDERQITPEAIYDLFKTCYVYERLCPVGLAAKCGHVQVMKTLIDAGFRVNEKSKHHDSVRPIHLACERGNLEVVKTLVEEYNVDITHIDNYYRKPVVCIAAENGHVEIVRYFIEELNISVNRRYGTDEYSALHAAAELNQVNVCKYLISKGADVNMGNNLNNTPLMLATDGASYDSARVLLDAGADVNFTNNKAESPFLNSAAYGDLDMMKLLQSYGADPELDDRYFSSPLHKAVSANRKDIVFYLVNELNVTIEPTSYYEDEREGQSVCMIALRRRSFDMVQHLFNAGYDPSKELAEYGDSDDDINSDGSSEDYDSIAPRKKRKSFPLRRGKVKLRELRQMISRPRSLLALSVLRVRRLLGRRFPVDLERLPLPDILENVIVLCGEEKP